jgi:hypothetical protein
MALPTTDPRGHALRAGFHAAYTAGALPVPVESMAVDLLGLYVEEAEIECSGLLIPSERRIVLGPASRSRASASPSPMSSARGCVK